MAGGSKDNSVHFDGTKNSTEGANNLGNGVTGYFFAP